MPGRKEDARFFDDQQRGLGVRVTTGGGKSDVAQYTFAGSKRRVPLGSCSAISLAAAREAVRTILGDAARGVDTAAERKAKLKAAADAVTLAGLIDRWDKLHLSARRANYSTAATSALRRAFARHLDRPAVSLDRAAVVRVLDGLSKDDKTAMAAHSPVMAARSMAGPFAAGRFQGIRSSACPLLRLSAASVSFRTTKSTGFGPELRARARSTASFECSC